MKPIKIVSTQRQDVLNIQWSPNNLCNYNCRYCYPGSNTGDYNSPKDLDLIIKNFNHLIDQYRQKLGKKSVHLKLSGGEPTLWKDLAYFIEAIKKENDIYLSILSNGSRTLRWWKEYGHLIDNAHLSLHLGQTNLDHIISVADTLYNYGKKTTVKVLMDPIRWQEGIDAINYMKENSKHPWFIIVSEVQEPDHHLLGSVRVVSQEEKKYTTEQLEFLKDSRKRLPPKEWFENNQYLLDQGIVRMFESVVHFSDGRIIEASPEYYISNSLNRFKGWSCNIGLEAICITWDGDIKANCFQKLYGLDYFYNILDKDFLEKFNLIPTPAICEYYTCNCQPEQHISKFSLS